MEEVPAPVAAQDAACKALAISKRGGVSIKAPFSYKISFSIL